MENKKLNPMQDYMQQEFEKLEKRVENITGINVNISDEEAKELEKNTTENMFLSADDIYTEFLASDEVIELLNKKLSGISDNNIKLLIVGNHVTVVLNKIHANKVYHVSSETMDLLNNSMEDLENE